MSDYNFLFFGVLFLLVTPIVIFEVGTALGDELPVPSETAFNFTNQLNADVTELCERDDLNASTRAWCVIWESDAASGVARALSPELAIALDVYGISASTSQETGVLGFFQQSVQTVLKPVVYVVDSYVYTVSFFRDIGIHPVLVFAFFFVWVLIIIVIIINKVVPFT